jgi:hypothetical protein
MKTNKEKESKLGVMAQPVMPATWEVEIRRTVVQGCKGKHKTPYLNK